MNAEMPMLRSALVAALNARRDNDVQVRIPLETGGCAQLAVRAVDYDPLADVIVIVTEEHLDGPAPDEGGSP